MNTFRENLDKQSLAKSDNVINKPHDGNIHMDNIFSYWIYLWFVAYTLVSFSSSKSKTNQFILKYLNPLLALIFALIENIVLFIHLIYIWPSTTIVVKYIVMMLIIKIFPIYELWDTKINWVNDLKYLFIVFTIYNVYLAIKGTNLIEVYIETYNSIANNRNETPMFYAINQFILWVSKQTGYNISDTIREKLGIHE